MQRSTLTIVLVLLGTMITVETASAGLFGLRRRIWQRRKAEVRAEVSYDLSRKLDKDLADVAKQLESQSQALIQSEAGRLEAEIRAGLAELRKEAAAQIAAEADRLRKQTDEQVKQLQTAAEQKVAAAAAKLKQQTDQQLQAALTKLVEQAAADKRDFTAQFNTANSALRKEINEQLANMKQQTAVENDSTPDNDAPRPQPPTNDRSEERAIAPKLPELQPENEEDGDDEQ